VTTTGTRVPDATAVERLQIIQNAKSVALVGVSNNPIRSSNFVASYLVRTPFETYAVNPAYDEVLGLKSYDTLADLPEVPDIVDVFRPHGARRRSTGGPGPLPQDRARTVLRALTPRRLQHRGGLVQASPPHRLTPQTSNPRFLGPDMGQNR
jgi:hypothetical protein